MADLIERGTKWQPNPPRPRAYGLPDTDPWVTAMDAVGDSNKKPLGDLLRSELALPQLARGYLADLIERGIAKPVGRPRVPLYNMSTVEAFLWLARDDVRHRPRGQPVEVALAAAAERYGQYGVTVDTLRKYKEGRREATNRKRKALPKKG